MLTSRLSYELSRRIRYNATPVEEETDTRGLPLTQVKSIAYFHTPWCKLIF
ncbi:hypothetical protein J2S74_001535 [Evansella vedderi]|uniref:Uncharacterized protein n=1 Tax=Evansella vedderi TaxID=38282 RepID=A0ABT9ZSG4_9BACI|nr:hypothetical protein [Evansella vedderi]